MAFRIHRAGYWLSLESSGGDTYLAAVGGRNELWVLSLIRLHLYCKAFLNLEGEGEGSYYLRAFQEIDLDEQ